MRPILRAAMCHLWTTLLLPTKDQNNQRQPEEGEGKDEHDRGYEPAEYSSKQQTPSGNSHPRCGHPPIGSSPIPASSRLGVPAQMRCELDVCRVTTKRPNGSRVN
ncbi:hypothetical protein VTJ04DRAFT_8687 [Mycothermus thermophilus]|uniref:uncharacterized protein n=1 Tax=Humicola insolens TaxID=85995 RepID=UPI003742EAFC